MACIEGQKEPRYKLFGERLPELPLTETLADTWRDLGCAKSSFEGPRPFDWQDLLAYSQLTRIDLAPFEAHCLMDMSRAYVNCVADTRPLSIAPMERKK